MLNFKNINFELLEKSVEKAVKTANIIEYIIIGVLITVFLIIIFLIIKSLTDKNTGMCSIDLSSTALIWILVSCVSINIVSITMNRLKPYAIASIEVIPTKEVSEEFLKQNDNFVEVDNKIYYKKTLYKPVWELRKNIKSKNEIEETLEKSFRAIIDAKNSEKWFKENTKSIDGKSK